MPACRPSRTFPLPRPHTPSYFPASGAGLYESIPNIDSGDAAAVQRAVRACGRPYVAAARC